MISNRKLYSIIVFVLFFRKYLNTAHLITTLQEYSIGSSYHCSTYSYTNLEAYGKGEENALKFCKSEDGRSYPLCKKGQAEYLGALNDLAAQTCLNYDDYYAKDDNKKK